MPNRLKTLSDTFKSKLALRLILWFGRLSFKRLHQLGKWAGLILFYGKTPSRHTVETNLSLAYPDWPIEKRQQTAKQNLIDCCQLSLEMAYLWTRPPEDGARLIQHIHGEHLLDEALKNPKGLLLILPHLGNWELTNHYLMQKTPLTALYKPISLPDVEQQVHQARSLGETNMVPTNQQGVKALIKTLKSGGVIVILPDQSPPEGNGQFAPFFGIPTYTSTLTSRLIAKTQAQCLCIFTHRLAQAQGFDIHITPVDDTLFDSDPNTALAGLNLSVELCIAPRVNQYLWTYKRFKIRPNQKFNPYDHPAQTIIERTPVTSLKPHGKDKVLS